MSRASTRMTCPADPVWRTVDCMPTIIDRRVFLGSAAAGLALPRVQAQTAVPEWGVPVLDIHLHLRRDPDANVAHLDGSGCQMANLLTRVSSSGDLLASLANYSARFVRSAATDITKPHADA